MRVLHLTSQVPYPPFSGGGRRELELLASARVRRRRARAARSLAHTLSPWDEAAVRLLECYEVALAGDRQLSA